MKAKDLAEKIVKLFDNKLFEKDSLGRYKIFPSFFECTDEVENLIISYDKKNRRKNVHSN